MVAALVFVIYHSVTSEYNSNIFLFNGAKGIVNAKTFETQVMPEKLSVARPQVPARTLLKSSGLEGVGAAGLVRAAREKEIQSQPYNFCGDQQNGCDRYNQPVCPPRFTHPQPLLTSPSHCLPGSKLTSGSLFAVRSDLPASRRSSLPRGSSVAKTSTTAT